MWMNGSWSAAATPAHARCTGKPSPSNPVGAVVTERTVQSEKFGRFLSAIFDEWVQRDVGKVYVTTFDVALGSWLGQHNACIIAPTCGGALVLEHNGDVYSCDHFVEPAHLLGNLLETPLAELVGSEKQRAFGRAKSETLPACCRSCEWLFTCHGECPKNRVLTTPDGEPGLNWLCTGLKAFFQHVDHPMRLMADLLRRGRSAPEVMEILAAEERPSAAARRREPAAASAVRRAPTPAHAGRNDPCPCGSGRKFKLCHGRV